MGGGNSREKGFTIIELLIAMAIGLVVLGALVSTLVLQRRIYDLQEQATAMIQSARAAMDMITREVRMAGYNPEGLTFDGITYDASQLHIQADLDGDGVLGGSNEDVIYTYDGINLQIDRDTGGGAQPFAENIEPFTFAYLDGSGNATVTSSAIRQIRITITARTEKPDPAYSPNSGYRTYTLSSLITPKNLDF